MKKEIIRIRLQNAVFFEFMSKGNDPGIILELREYFSFFASNYKFHPLYKQKRWDGKIYLVNAAYPRLYVGLLPYLIDFCSERNYGLKIEENHLIGGNNKELYLPSPMTEEDAAILDSIPKKYEPRDYQQEAVIRCIENKRQIILSATGSGKSFMMYLLAFWFIKKNVSPFNKILIIVPTTALVSQMKKDFIDYSMDEKNVSPLIHEIYSGKEKYNIDAPIVISTFQSLTSKNAANIQWMTDVGMIICDEVHRATAKSFVSILERCHNSYIKNGWSGSIPTDKETKINEMTLTGLIGPVHRVATSKVLQDKGQLAKLEIDCIILNHKKGSFIPSIPKKKNDNTTTSAKRFKEEIDYLGACERRNQFIVDTAFTQPDSSNVLVLFALIEKHGIPLYELAKERNENKEVFFISGQTPVEERERIRETVESKKKGCIIFASSSVFATGTNIRNLHSIIFAHSFKSQIRVIQSIGRGLRVSDNGKPTKLIDIMDDLSEGKKSKRNYVMNHAIERLQYYTNEQWRYKIHTIDNF